MTIPIEDFELGGVGKVTRLNLSLYGTRDAAQNWAEECATFLEERYFEAGLASPCSFEHVSRELKLTVHGDDFTVTGPSAVSAPTVPEPSEEPNLRLSSPDMTKDEA